MTQPPSFASPSPPGAYETAPMTYQQSASQARAPQVYPEPPRRGKQRRQGAPVAVWLMAIILAFALGLVTGGIAAREYFGLGDRALPSVPTSQQGSELPPSVTAAQSDVGKVAKSVLNSTVYIEAYTGNAGGSGTGFIYRSDGTIVTNAHVIAPTGSVASDIMVTTPEGDRLPAKVVGLTSEYDIAVITIDASDLTALPLADSSTIAVGDEVVAVGAPLGLTGTVTTGIVSATDRPVRSGDTETTSFINAVQTDAAINPGNSGGPLVNMAGQMVGLNSAIAQPVGNSQQGVGSIGLGFAIPSSQVARTADEILDKGYATYPIMGIMVDMSDRRVGARILDDAENSPGIVVGGPAEASGLRAGDRIVTVNGKRIGSPTEFIVYLRSLQPGQTISVIADRNGEQVKAEVTLDEARAK